LVDVEQSGYSVPHGTSLGASVAFGPAVDLR
jgi:hypothetical protein